MTAADEAALSFYLPLMLILAVIDLTVSAYWSLDGKHSKAYAFGNLLLNMSWSCTLFPLLLNQEIFSRSLEALYADSPRTVHPFSDSGLFWFSLLLTGSLLLVNTIDVYQGFKSAEQSEPPG